MFCSKCGLAIPDDSRTCPYCSHPVSTKQSEQMLTPYYKNAKRVNPNDDHSYHFNADSDGIGTTVHNQAVISEVPGVDNKDSEAKENNKPLYIVIFVFSAVLLIAIISLIIRLSFA